jgi:hypothetical protein
MMEAEGISLKVLGDIDQMARLLSAHDMADIHLALQGFSFSFDSELQIELAQSPLTRLSASETHESVHYRVNERVQSQTLRQQAEGKNFTPVYTLNPVDENLWVAVQQRLHNQTADPSQLLLSSNQAFFDDLIAQALHCLPFEQVCKTNLFTYYLGTLPVKAA